MTVQEMVVVAVVVLIFGVIFGGFLVILRTLSGSIDGGM